MLLLVCIRLSPGWLTLASLDRVSPPPACGNAKAVASLRDKGQVRSQQVAILK